jgi:peptidoglycan hydrolase-like protein with peptidoglycan-binding domain
MATKLGDRDGDVGRLQDLLRQRGFDPGATDEKFGPKTKAALEAYQKTEGLTVTGIAGPSTWSILAAQVATQ